MNTEPHIGQKIRLLNNAFAQALNQNLSAHGLTGAQSFFLDFIYRREFESVPVHSKELTEYFQLKHSTVSGILQRLEANGFIRFVPDARDHRYKRIELTEKALLCRREATSAFNELEKKILDGFTESETDLFCQFLSKAADNIAGCLDPHIHKGE